MGDPLILGIRDYIALLDCTVTGLNSQALKVWILSSRELESKLFHCPLHKFIHASASLQNYLIFF